MNILKTNDMSKTLMSILLVLFAFAFDANADACEKQKDKVEEKLNECKDLGKGNSKYRKCAKDFKDMKAKYKIACSDKGLDSQAKTWKDYTKNNCKTKTTRRCAAAYKKLGTIEYKIANAKIIQCENEYEEAYQRWEDRDRKGKEPKQCKKNFAKAINAFKTYLDQYPKHNSYANVLMQLSFIYVTLLQEDRAFVLWKKLVEDYPGSALVPKARLRMGEFYYNNRKHREAIEQYKIVLSLRDQLNPKEAAMAIYHLAESQNNVGDYEESAKTFYEYVTGSDEGRYPNDFRQEALIYMAGTFADIDNGIDVAMDYLKKKEVTFKDTLFFEIGMKNMDRDRLDEAAYSFERLLEYNDTYVDAPIAHVKLLKILDEKKETEKAQEERLKVVKLYTTSSDWYKKNSANQEAIKNSKQAIRDAYFDIPAYYHRKADKLDKEGDVDSAAEQYDKALVAYNEFLKAYPEASWDQYRTHEFMASVHLSRKQFIKAADEFNWMDDADTTRYGRKPRGYPKVLTKAEAGYNAVIAMDKGREAALADAKGDYKKAFNAPGTQRYLSQVERYMKRYGTDPKNEEAAELAYNAALVYYNAEKYKTAVTVLAKLKTTYPKHKYIKQITKALANSYTQAGDLDKAEAEYEFMLKKYYSNPKDTNHEATLRAIAAVKFQKADKLSKNGQYEKAAQSYLALQKRFPAYSFSDKALFEAAHSYEKAKKYKKAADVYMEMPRNYASSPLTIKAVLKSAAMHQKLKDWATAATTFLFITDQFPKDSMAFKAIGFAAASYDSIPDKAASARTFELALEKYPKHPQTPSFLYSACLAYEKGKMTDEAIACNKRLVKEFPKSSYAVDAAYSVGFAYETGKQWKKAAEAYISFADTYDSDGGKVVQARFKAAKSYHKIGETKLATPQWKETIKAFEKYGLKLNADPAIPAEAAFRLGEYIREDMQTASIKGSAAAKGKQIKKLAEKLKAAVEEFKKSAVYASEKWTFKATNELGKLFVIMAKKIREQEITGSVEEQFIERITIVQQLPTWYEQAIPLLENNIQIAREQGYYNADVIQAEEAFVEMYYQSAAVFDEVADAFRNAPVPDISGVPAEDIKYELMDNFGYTEEEIGNDPHKVWTDKYRGDLEAKAITAEEGGVPKFEVCIKASAHYSIKNQWSDKCQERLLALDETNETNKLTWEKIDPSKLFQDKIYFKSKSRIEQIFSSTAMSDSEKVETLQKITAEAKAAAVELKQQVTALRAKLAPVPAAGETPAAQ